MSDTGFDPDAVDDRPARSSHITPREVKILGVIVLVFALISWPIYTALKEDSQRFQCRRNFGDMFKSMSLYMADWSDRYPPAYATTGDDPEIPLLDGSGRPFTWGSLIQRYASRTDMLLCPSATADEAVKSQDPASSARDLRTTYGLYVGLAGQPQAILKNPSTTVVFSETANRGAAETFDPFPLRAPDGGPAPDGFLIGYSNGNLEPDASTFAVTRLAYKGTKGGRFDANMPARHRAVNHYLFADGSVALLNAEAARVRMLGSDLAGYWERP